MRIRPARYIRGSLRVPGDKSISHRAAIFAALARGVSRINHFSSAEDCASTLACLHQLGVCIERDQSSVLVDGTGLRGLRAPHAPLDCGNSGTTLRLLAGVLAGQSFDSVLTGDESLRSRPMRRIIEPLEMMGARIISENDRAPLRIEGRASLKAISYEMPVESAQVKSAILLAGLNANGLTEVIEKHASTRDHTERMLRWLNVAVESRIIERREDEVFLEAISIEGRAQFDARSGTIPGDISSASFLIAAAACLPGSNLEINKVGLNPTRTRVLSVLRSLGAEVNPDLSENNERGTEDFNERWGSITVSGGAGLAPVASGHANVLSGTLTAQLIDELPLLAVVGTQVSGGLEIRDAAELRVKESDRISATVQNLRAMGADVEEHEDGLSVRGRTVLRGAQINAGGDHRIAMAFTVAALLAEGESEIAGAECVTASFPEFFELLESVVER